MLDEGRFAVTIEYNPPKGTNIVGILENAKRLVGRVHGVNVTDNTAAVVRAGSLPVCRLLYEMGHDPVMQLTCRDRNRIAMQSDLMGAHMLGIRNILCLTGDYPTVGDHKEAKPVYDLDSVQVMQMVRGLNEGRDLTGHKLDGATEFTIAAAATPEADLVGPVLMKFEVKIKAGAEFSNASGLQPRAIRQLHEGCASFQGQGAGRYTLAAQREDGRVHERQYPWNGGAAGHAR